MTSPITAMDGVVHIPFVKVEAANAVSSPHTWGFPAPTAFTGFAHAIQRHLEARPELTILGVAVICHQFEPLVHGRYAPKRFALARHPVRKDGKPASIIEDGRAHFTASLLLAVRGTFSVDMSDIPEVEEDIEDICQTMRLAGGSIRCCGTVKLHEWPELPDEQFAKRRQLTRSLVPGFALVSRHDLLATRLGEMLQTNPDATPLDVVLDAASLTYDAHPADDGNVEWRQRRKEQGWIVPIPVGYQAISDVQPAGTVANARDNETPFCFVESALSLGQWISPHRIETLEQLFWYHDYEPERGTYRCINHFA